MARHLDDRVIAVVVNAALRARGVTPFGTLDCRPPGRLLHDRIARSHLAYEHEGPAQMLGIDDMGGRVDEKQKMRW